MTNEGKLPPHDLEAERAVLAALIIEPNSVNLVAGKLKESHFYFPAHVIIFSCINKLFESGSSIDMITVTSQLNAIGKLEDVGGAYFIADITRHVASAAHLEQHVSIIIDFALRRKAIQLAFDLQAKAFDKTISLDNIFSSAIDIEKQLSDDVDLGSDISSLPDVVDSAILEMEHRCDMFIKKEPIGIPTPLSTLNSMLIGFMRTQFILIGARPGHGKTAFALACAKHQAKQGFKPAIFTLEMSNMSLVNRLMTAEAGVDAMSFRKGNLSTIEKQRIIDAGKNLKKYNIYISDKASSNVAQIKAVAKKLISEGECDIVYVDYLQLVTVGDQNTREQQISAISRSLKLMSMELKIPVVAMSQLSRTMEIGDKRPKLSHLRESGSLEQDADVVLFLFRPSEYGLFDDDGYEYQDTDSEIIIAKQREGPTGKILTKTNSSKSVYYDIEKSYEEKEEPRNFHESTTRDIFKDFEQDLASIQGNSIDYNM